LTQYINGRHVLIIKFVLITLHLLATSVSVFNELKFVTAKHVWGRMAKWASSPAHPKKSG